MGGSAWDIGARTSVSARAAGSGRACERRRGVRRSVCARRSPFCLVVAVGGGDGGTRCVHARRCATWIISTELIAKKGPILIRPKLCGDRHQVEQQVSQTT